MKVKFLPQNIELEINPDQSVMELAHKNGIFIKSVCNGVPNCAECRVKIVEGEYNVLPPSRKELTLIGSGHFIDRRRLSCQLHCFGDVTVDLSEQMRKENEGPPGSRRFQVELRNEGIVSKAVTGNLIQQDQDIEEALKESSAITPTHAHTHKHTTATHAHSNTKFKSNSNSNSKANSQVNFNSIPEPIPKDSKSRVEALLQNQNQKTNSQPQSQTQSSPNKNKPSRRSKKRWRK